MHLRVFDFFIWFENCHAWILGDTSVPGCWVCISLSLLVGTCMSASVSQTLHVSERGSISGPPCSLLLGIGKDAITWRRHYLTPRWHLSSFWQAKEEFGCWRMFGQALCSDSCWLNSIFLQVEICRVFQELLLAPMSEPPGSLLSPFLIDPTRKGEGLVEINMGVSFFPTVFIFFYWHLSTLSWHTGELAALYLKPFLLSKAKEFY